MCLNRIAILLENCSIAIMSMEKGFYITDKFEVGRVYNRIVLSPNSSIPYLIYSDDISIGTVRLYHMGNKSRNYFHAHYNPILMMCISTDGRMLATASCNVLSKLGANYKNI